MSCGRALPSPRRHGRAALIAWAPALAWLALGGCRVVEPEVTAVRLVVTWPSSLMVDQLALALFDEQDRMLGPRELRPTAPAAPLQPGTDLVVYLPEAQAGHEVRFVLEGLASGQVVGAGEAQATVAASRVVALAMELRDGPGGGPGDAGDAGGATDATDREDAGAPDAPDCVDGGCP